MRCSTEQGAEDSLAVLKKEQSLRELQEDESVDKKPGAARSRPSVDATPMQTLEFDKETILHKDEQVDSIVKSLPEQDEPNAEGGQDDERVLKDQWVSDAIVVQPGSRSK